MFSDTDPLLYRVFHDL